MDDQKLAELLVKACPRPAFMGASDGGPVLALALHCLMVDAGFVLATEAGRTVKPETRFVPPKDWNGLYLDQWIFEYKKPGKARKFTLHCSLQARSKRMFIHCSEDNNPANTCVLGLQVDNYVPSPSLLKSNSWEGVVCNAAKMRELLTEYVLTPLQQNAEDEQGDDGAADGEQVQPHGGEGGGWLASWGWIRSRGGAQRQQLVYVASAAVVVGVVMLVLARRSGYLRRRSL